MLREAAPIAAQLPALLPLIGSVIKFAVQRQRAGRTIEQEFEKALDAVGQAPQGDPAQAAQMQEQQAMMQQEAEKLKQEGQAQQVRGMELQYGETYAKEKIAMQQQLAAKDIEIQRINAERDLEKLLASITEQERALEMRQMEIDARDMQSKQSEQVRATVMDLKARIAEMGEDSAEGGDSEDGSEKDDAQMAIIAEALQSLVEIARAPQSKSGLIKAPSGRAYEVNLTQQPYAESR
jgi:hypothetical protein